MDIFFQFDCESLRFLMDFECRWFLLDFDLAINNGPIFKTNQKRFPSLPNIKFVTELNVHLLFQK
jgi:hypothetical protein